MALVTSIRSSSRATLQSQSIQLVMPVTQAQLFAKTSQRKAHTIQDCISTHPTIFSWPKIANHWIRWKRIKFRPRLGKKMGLDTCSGGSNWIRAPRFRKGSYLWSLASLRIHRLLRISAKKDKKAPQTYQIHQQMRISGAHQSKIRSEFIWNKVAR